MLLLVAALLAAQDAGALVEKLRSESVEERDAAERGLRTLGRAARPALEKACADKDGEVASRAKRILRILELEETLPPRLRKAVPGVEERLAGDDGAWTELLIELEEADAPKVEIEDLDALVAPALRGARTGAQREQVCGIVIRGWMRSAIPHLMTWLEHGSLEDKQVSAYALQQLRAQEAIPQLRAALRDSSPVVRHAALQALGFLRDLESTPTALELLKDPNPEIRTHGLEFLYLVRARDRTADILALLERDPDRNPLAATALAALGARDAAPSLRRLLPVAGPTTQVEIIKTLVDIDHRAAAPEIARLLASRDRDVRSAALGALSSFDYPEAAPQVLPFLADPNHRTTAARTLISLDGRRAARELAALALDQGTEKGKWAFEALFQLRPRDAGTVVASLLRHKDPSVAEQGFELARQLALPEAVPEALRMLSSEDPPLRLRGLAILEVAGPPDTTASVVACLRREPDLQAAALETLATMAGRAAAPEILAAYPALDPAVRAKALVVLARLGYREAVPLILKGLEDTSLSTRLYATEAAAELKIREAAPRIVALLDDPEARSETLAALVDVDARPALPRVREILKDSTGDDAKEALAVLMALGDAAAVPAILALLERDEESREKALEALGVLGSPEIAPRLEPYLRNAPDPVRKQAALALGRLDVTRLDPLLRSRNESLRIAAIQALGRIGAKEQVPRLLAMLPEATKHERMWIARSLGQIGDPGAIPAVVALLEDEYPGAVQEAVQAAVALRAREAIPALEGVLHDPVSTAGGGPAAGALVALGSRAGVRTLLQEGTRLWPLNSLRRPEVWARLGTTTLAEPIKGMPLDALVDLARAAGLKLDLSEAALPYGKVHYRFEKGSTIRFALEWASHGPRNAIILESDRIRVVDRDRALDFWRAWERE